MLISFRSILQEILEEKDKFQSLKQDVLPYLVRSQLVGRIKSVLFYKVFVQLHKS